MFERFDTVLFMCFFPVIHNDVLCLKLIVLDCSLFLYFYSTSKSSSLLCFRFYSLLMVFIISWEMETEHEQDSNLNINQVCRVCLKQNEFLRDICNETMNGICVFDMFNSITDFKVRFRLLSIIYLIKLSFHIKGERGR